MRENGVDERGVRVRFAFCRATPTFPRGEQFIVEAPKGYAFKHGLVTYDRVATIAEVEVLLRSALVKL